MVARSSSFDYSRENLVCKRKCRSPAFGKAIATMGYSCPTRRLLLLEVLHIPDHPGMPRISLPTVRLAGRVRARMEDRFVTWLEIDLSAIEDNVRRLCALTRTPLMAVVKANGYGHGAPQVARAAAYGGAALPVRGPRL